MKIFSFFAIGNFIPKYEDLETTVPSAIPAAVELACVNNKANTIAVVGHSDCKVILSSNSSKSAIVADYCISLNF